MQTLAAASLACGERSGVPESRPDRSGSPTALFEQACELAYLPGRKAHPVGLALTAGPPERRNRRTEMSEIETLGVVVEFEAAAEFEDGTTIVMSPSRPSKADCLLIAWAYLDAPEPEQDAMLAEFGGTLLRRSLRALRNYAARTNQPEVAAYLDDLRAEITLVRDDKTEAAS